MVYKPEIIIVIMYSLQVRHNKHKMRELVTRHMVPHLVLSLKFPQVTLNLVSLMFLTGDATAVATFHSPAWIIFVVP